MIVDILVPTLGRPHALEPLIRNIHEVTPSGRFWLLFVCDEDDRESIRAIEAAIELHGQGHLDFAVVPAGTYPEKINEGYRLTSSELVLPTADDVVFHPGWYQAALAEFRDGVHVVGTNDLSPATADRSHATMPLIRRAYAEDPGAAWGEQHTIFHEGYRHNYVETETCQLAQHRGVWAFAETSVIEHLHPAWGKRETDDTDRKGNLQGFDDDADLFRRRKRQWERQRS